MADGRARVAWGGLFFALGLMAVFPVPEYHLWLCALIATEGGHWLAIGALLTLAPGWQRTVYGRLGAALGVTAAVLLLTPLIRAEFAFSRPDLLDQSLAAAFGTATPRLRENATSRSAPLVWTDLWRGIPSPTVRESAEVYGHDHGAELRLQLYRPIATTELMPVVVVVHGGSWQSGSRLDMPQLSRYLAARGYAVASLDYGLAPNTLFPGQIQNIRDAASFLRAHARDFSLDPTRIALLGRSAGAQIVLAAAADAAVPGLKGVISFYGPNDLWLAWTLPGSRWLLDTRALLRQYMGGSPAEFPERYNAGSALLRAGRTFPPTLMIHGGRDELVWPLHEIRLSERLGQLGVPHAYVNLPWATHGCDYAFSGPCGQVSTYAVERFLAGVLK